MNQRGFTWWKLGLVLAAIALLYVGVGWVNSEIEEGKRVAHDAGRRAALLEVAQRDNEQLLEAQAEFARLTAAADALERGHEEEMAALDLDLTRRLRDVEARKDRFVGDVVAGRIRLYDPGRAADSCGAGRGDGTEATATAGPRLDHGAGGAELSPALGSFLGSEAARADKVVLKLTACQGTVRSYLTTCNADTVSAPAP